MEVKRKGESYIKVTIFYTQMDEKIYILTAAKFLEICGCNAGAAIYSLLPTVDKKPEYYKGLYGHILENQPALLDSALEIFTGRHTDVAKGSYTYTRIKEEKESFLNLVGHAKQFTKIPSIISDDKVSSALSLISHSYIDSFFWPIQFFVPHSSTCCGQWGLWDKIDYIKLKELFNKKETVFSLMKIITGSNIWDTKMKLDNFQLIVRRRLVKEKLLNKKLDPAAMIKAMIIRLGELARPNINYEIVDYSIRSFFTYLGVKKYLRVDREILFLRKFEEEFMDVLAKI